MHTSTFARPMMTPEDAPPNLVEVFRSLRLADCDQQTLILSAVGIHSWTVVRGGVFVVVVAEESAALAQRHLNEVAKKRRQRRYPFRSRPSCTHARGPAPFSTPW